MRATLACATLLCGTLFSVSTPAENATVQPLCAHTPAAADALTRLRTAMAQDRFIDYEPTSLQVIYGHPTQADPASIRADLKALRPRFDALITYDAIHGAEAIPAIAAELGFHAVIIGVWDPFNTNELDAALTAARQNPGIVVGLSLGNEMLFFHRHELKDELKLLDEVHSQAPGLALSTTEQFHIFADPALRPVLQRLDFLLANVHPVFQPWFATASNADSVQFVLNVTNQLAQEFCGPVLVKETGIPTAPAEKGFNASRQAEFYAELAHRFPATRERAFAYFSAFDAPWRLKDNGAAEEAYWGLYDQKRQPKAVVASIAPLAH